MSDSLCSPDPVVKCGEQYDLAVPAGIQRVCREYGGLNPYGEPLFRVVWGWQRLHVLEGVWQRGVSKVIERHGISCHLPGSEVIHVGAMSVPKYARLTSFFILERWLPSSHYGTPETWKEATEKWEPSQGRSFLENGPFPSRGDYEMIWHFHNPWDESFEPVTENMVINRIQWNLQRQARTPGDIRKEARFDADHTEKLTNAKMDDAHEKNVAAFPFKSWVPVSGTLPSLMPGWHR